MIYTKKGFTLMEIMVVLAIIGIFFVITSSMTDKSRSYQVNSERLANSIYDTIRGSRNNMMIGRGAYSGSELITVTERNILVSNTGILVTYLHNATNSGTESSLMVPFFDNDGEYKIVDIAVSTGGFVSGAVPVWTNTGLTSVIVNLNSNSDVSMTTVPAVSSARTLRITAGYHGFEQSVIFDRVTGAIEIKKSNED